MIALPAGVKVWLAAGATDMRKGFDGLAALVQTQLTEDPFSGQLFVFRGRAGDRVKILWWSGDGLCLFAKRLESGHFVWPQATHGTVSLTAAQLSMLLEALTGGTRCAAPRHHSSWYKSAYFVGFSVARSPACGYIGACLGMRCRLM